MNQRPIGPLHTFTRREVSRSIALAACAAGSLFGARNSEPEPARLSAWMYVITPLERWLTDYRRIFDAWAEGGVRGIVVGGPLRFWDGPPSFDLTYARKGAVISTFRPNPAVYRKFDVEPPGEVRLDEAKERQFRAL
ncbi:MAG: hypothetical protein NTY38_16015, partial [Acidobacteria bacterium]|nr:hypothetical protein [Acidobacteriota bacterium]